ncbi:AraC family transcriptional regulator [Agathobaculum sp.]|uniref:AraC family transcriptional regulator n=1 Tax=Agathobaculum sp. TaxID=2048138 RepID=UPI002A803D37|nr:AraC family transcriptional regulator [Agathobaculum sp.]MDY3617589.1 AraC family transcriptional regulator [Agathobaculum sp.]
MKNIEELAFSGYKFVVYYAETLDQWIAEFPHNHPLYEIYYVLEGSIRINIAGSTQELAAGQACVLAKDVKHHVYYNPDVPKRYFALIFDLVPCEQLAMNGPDGPLEFSDITQALAPVDTVGYQVVSDLPAVEPLIGRLNAELREKRLGWNTQAVLLCYQIAIQTLRQLGAAKVRDTHFAGRENLAMQGSMYIHAHYPENVSVENAAEALNVSPRHLSRAYKAMFSTTFIKNTNLLRIAYAKNYLCTTDYSIEEIAEKIGFSSPRALYKLFQQYEGLSLSQYREQHKKGKPED